MAVKKGSDLKPQQLEVTAPLQGALREVGENNDQAVLLQMVLNQMKAAEQERRLEMQALQQTLTATQDDFKRATAEWHAELAKMKRENAQALDAVREKFQELIEKKPVDTKTWQAMYRTAMKQAQEQMAANHAKFLEELKTMPKGTINNDEGKVVVFQINGVTRIIKQGQNRKVPRVFVDEWKKRKKRKAWATNLDNALQAERGDAPANEIAVATGRAPIWNEETGRV